MSDLVLAAILVVIIGAAIYDRLQLPPHRVLPPPAHPNVLLVPIGPVPADRLAGYPADYRSEYGISVTIAPPIALSPAAYDAARRQYVAQGLLSSVALAHPGAADDGVILIGVTTADMYIRDVPWNWAFGYRTEGRSAVVSAARMPDTRYTSKWWLLRKMVTREIGFLCFELSPTDNPRDLLYRNILGSGDLRRLSEHL